MIRSGENREPFICDQQLLWSPPVAYCRVWERLRHEEGDNNVSLRHGPSETA